MNQLDIQLATQSDNLPDEEQFQLWIDAVLADDQQDREVVIRIVDEAEMTALNESYRQKTGPTNILSFPFQPPPQIESNLLGDLIICAPVIDKEAKQQNKKVLDHWAHIVVHGMLHLLGYDHLTEEEAQVMENLEINILQSLHISNPYQEDFINE